MTITVDAHLDFLGTAQLMNVLFENVANTSGLTAEGQFDYVAGTDHHMYGHDGTSARQIPWATDNGIFKPLAANPAANTAGETWFDTTNGLLKFNDGTAAKTVATTDQIGTMFRTRAIAFDASAGALPTAADATNLAGEALQTGDVFVIGTGGTIAGIGGADTLEPGDMLVLFDDGNVASAASWTAFQVNVDLPTNITTFENVTLTLAASTAATITPTVLTSVHNVEMYTAAGQKRPFMDLVVTGGATATVTSLNALTDARAYCEGLV